MKLNDIFLKTILTAVTAIVLISFNACEKNGTADPGGLSVQVHNQNKMIKIMHKMSHSMDTMTNMNNVDHDFAMMMKMHHLGAIDMANYQLAHGDDSLMNAKANQIILTQTAEIAELNIFLNNHMDMDNTNSAEYNKVVMASMNKMTKGADLQIVTGDSDNDFAALMIVHHQSATEMADAQIEFGKDAGLKTMAKKMIADQSIEIDEFQDWLLINKPY